MTDRVSPKRTRATRDSAVSRPHASRTNALGFRGLTKWLGLVYVGGVATGFTQASGTALRNQMDKLIIEKPASPMPVRKKSYRWIKPELIAEIALRGWTDDEKLRHASYKGLREDADEACVFEMNQ